MFFCEECIRTNRTTEPASIRLCRTKGVSVVETSSDLACLSLCGFHIPQQTTRNCHCLFFYLIVNRLFRWFSSDRRTYCVPTSPVLGLYDSYPNTIAQNVPREAKVNDSRGMCVGTSLAFAVEVGDSTSIYNGDNWFTTPLRIGRRPGYTLQIVDRYDGFSSLLGLAIPALKSKYYYSTRESSRSAAASL